MFGEQEASGGFTPHYFQKRVRFMKEPPVPKIQISREAYTKMWLYVDIAPEEVGWMGTAKQLPNGDFFIEKVWLLKQEVTGVQTELSTEGLNDLAMDLLNRGDEGMEDWNNLRFWGHSHVRMGTSPSGTDENTMLRFEETGHPWFIRGILNKMGRIEFTLFLYEQGLKIEDSPWTVVGPPPARIKKVEETEEPVVELSGGTGKVISLTEAPATAESAAEPDIEPAVAVMENEGGVTLHPAITVAEPVASPAVATAQALVPTETVAPVSETAAPSKDGETAETAAPAKDGETTETAAPAKDGATTEAPAKDGAATTGDAENKTPATEKKSEKKKFFSFKPYRDPLFEADVTPELRAEVQAEFDAKVTARRWYQWKPEYQGGYKSEGPDQGEPKGSGDDKTSKNEGTSEKPSENGTSVNNPGDATMADAHNPQDLRVHDMEGIDNSMTSASRAAAKEKKEPKEAQPSEKDPVAEGVVSAWKSFCRFVGKIWQSDPQGPSLTAPSHESGPRREQGTVKFVNDAGGYGFISTPNGKEVIFQIASVAEGIAKPGAPVHFVLENGHALDVQVLPVPSNDCQSCHAALQGTGNYCTKCGAAQFVRTPFQSDPYGRTDNSWKPRNSGGQPSTSTQRKTHDDVQ